MRFWYLSDIITQSTRYSWLYKANVRLQHWANIIWYKFQQRSARVHYISPNKRTLVFLYTDNWISFQQLLCFCSIHTTRVFKIYNLIVLWSLFTRYIVFEYKLRQYWAKTATIFLLHLFIPPPALEWFSGGSTKMRWTTFIIVSFYFYLFRLYRNGKYTIHLIDVQIVYV